MSETLPLPIECQVSELPVPPLRAWIVVAYWRGRGWRLFPEQWSELVRAQRFARELPRGWSHRTVLRVEVDG